MEKQYPGYKCYDGQVKKLKNGILHLDCLGTLLKFRLSSVAKVAPGMHITVAYKDSDKKKIRDARIFCELTPEEKEFEMAVAGEFDSYRKGIMTIKPYGCKKREKYKVETDKKIDPKMFVSLGYSSIDRSEIPMARIIRVAAELKPLTDEEIAKIPGVTNLQGLPHCNF